MTNISGRVAALWALATITSFTLATPAFSQAPTDAQRSAIRSACRSDYIAHCSSVPPGGMASLQCLQKNMSSLSSSCKAVVNAIEAPAEPKAEAKPEAKPETKPAAAPAASSAAPAEKPAAEAAPTPAPGTAPKMPPEKTAAPATAPAATNAARKPSSAQVAAIRSACRSDYMAHCSSVPTGGAVALKCLQKNMPKLSGGCQQAVNAAGGSTSAPAAAGNAPAAANTAGPGAVPAAAPAPAPLILRPMRPREVLFVLRSACGGDVRALCGGVPAGGGRIVACLAEQAAALSPSCRNVLSSFAQ